MANFCQCCRGEVVITTAQLHSTKAESSFCAGLNPAGRVSEIRNGENLWQWSWMEIRLNAFRRSTISKTIHRHHNHHHHHHHHQTFQPLYSLHKPPYCFILHPCIFSRLICDQIYKRHLLFSRSTSAGTLLSQKPLIPAPFY